MTQSKCLMRIWLSVSDTRTKSLQNCVNGTFVKYGLYLISTPKPKFDTNFNKSLEPYFYKKSFLAKIGWFLNFKKYNFSRPYYLNQSSRPLEQEATDIQEDIQTISKTHFFGFNSSMYPKTGNFKRKPKFDFFVRSL